MKKIILSTALVAMTAFSGSALAASINGNANVNIISALAISEATEIDFGVTAGAAVDGVTFTPTIDGGLNTVTLDGSGAASVTVHGSLALSAATVGDKDIAYTFTANYQ